MDLILYVSGINAIVIRVANETAYSRNIAKMSVNRVIHNKTMKHLVPLISVAGILTMLSVTAFIIAIYVLLRV